MAGLVHIYCGDGKGKSTAAVGLTVRASAYGKKVIFSQFLKDGSSSEIETLKKLPNVTVLTQDENFGFVKRMSPETRKAAEKAYGKLLDEILKAAENADLIVMDEAVAACRHGIISEEKVLQFIRKKQEDQEIVLTGRNPSEALMAAADYISEVKKVKHPFDQGIPARAGIEY